jgi:uncharacterized protein (DUF2249 family)
MSQSTITIDVRADIRDGGDPFNKIMSAVDGLKPGENLFLIAPFEPVPLFHVLAKQGFRHDAQINADGDWEVLFHRERSLLVEALEKAPTSGWGSGSHPSKSARVIELDARGLEPPQPLVTILEALSALPQGAELRAQTDRRPLHLYSQLEERGFTGQTEEINNGSFITHIRRI